MYRLLIVTEDQSVWDMFAAMDGWEAMGLKVPRLRKTVDEALECMRKHHIDAIALDDSEALAPLEKHLDEQCPSMPIFRIESAPDKQLDTIREVCSMLTKLYADDSNDFYDTDSSFQQLRNRWIRKALSGMVATEDEIRRGLRLYRCHEQPGASCVLAQLSLPTDDAFMTSRWHYGSDRLETALRNFFGEGHNQMRLHVAVVSPQEVRVLCYPKDPEAGVEDAAASEYIRETVEQIERYLGLRMQVMSLRRVPGVETLAADHIA